MKKVYLVTAMIAIFSVIFFTYGFITFNKKHNTIKNKNGFAVIELFTSEGCSSCPPADRAIANLLMKNTGNVYILSYHVDYWNRLGWKDIFSKPEFSVRQQQYASHFSSESVYTPQVIVNGAIEFVGSDENKLNAAVSDNLKNDENSDINISATKNAATVTVSYDISEQNMVLLNIAFIQPGATTNVNGGENGGRTLHHVNIARALKTIDAKGKGTLTIEIPKELSNIPFELVAFTQDKNTFKILGADKKDGL